MTPQFWPSLRAQRDEAIPRTGPRTDSAAGRRDVVFGVGDVLAPGCALALLAGFRECEMREQAIGGGAVPMQRIGRNVDDIARVQYLRLLALEADAADPAQAVKRLPDGVGKRFT